MPIWVNEFGAENIPKIGVTKEEFEVAMKNLVNEKIVELISQLLKSKE